MRSDVRIVQFKYAGQNLKFYSCKAPEYKPVGSGISLTYSFINKGVVDATEYSIEVFNEETGSLICGWGSHFTEPIPPNYRTPEWSYPITTMPDKPQLKMRVQLYNKIDFSGLSDTKYVTVKRGLEWTHKLVINFYRLPWADEARANVAFRDIVIPAINVWKEIIEGYDYVGYVLYWDKWQCEVRYREKGSPAIPLAKILAVIAAIAVAAGIICLALAWYKRETRIEKTTMKKSELLEQGLITQEQYEELIKAETEEKAPWEAAVFEWLPLLIFFLIIIAIAGALPKRREETL